MARRYYQDRGREDITFCFSILVASPNTAHNQTCSQDTERLRHQRGKYTTVKNGMGKGFYELLKYISFYWHIIPPIKGATSCLTARGWNFGSLMINPLRPNQHCPGMHTQAAVSFGHRGKTMSLANPFFFFFNCFGPLKDLRKFGTLPVLQSAFK